MENRTRERAFLVYARRKRLKGPASLLHQSEVMKELEDLVRSAGAEVAASHVQAVETEKPGDARRYGNHRASEGDGRGEGGEPRRVPETS